MANVTVLEVEALRAEPATRDYETRKSDKPLSAHTKASPPLYTTQPPGLGELCAFHPSPSRQLVARSTTSLCTQMFQLLFQEPVLSTMEFKAHEPSPQVKRAREKAPRAAAWFLQKEEDTERKLRGDLTGKCVQGAQEKSSLCAELHLPSARPFCPLGGDTQKALLRGSGGDGSRAVSFYHTPETGHSQLQSRGLRRGLHTRADLRC